MPSASRQSHARQVVTQSTGITSECRAHVRGVGATCYGSVKNGFDSAVLAKIPRMKKEERAGSSTDD